MGGHLDRRTGRRRCRVAVQAASLADGRNRRGANRDDTIRPHRGVRQPPGHAAGADTNRGRTAGRRPGRDVLRHRIGHGDPDRSVQGRARAPRERYSSTRGDAFGRRLGNGVHLSDGPPDQPARIADHARSRQGSSARGAQRVNGGPSSGRRRCRWIVERRLHRLDRGRAAALPREARQVCRRPVGVNADQPPNGRRPGRRKSG